MDPASLIPTPDALPAPWPWLKAMLIPLFVVHLLFMNALVGTGVIGWVQVWGAGGASLDAAGRIRRKLPFYAAFAVNFGVAALLFTQVLYGNFFYTSSILMAVWWLSALALVLTAYGAAYWIDFRFHRPVGVRRFVWTVMVAALLLVAFIFVNNITLMQDPGAWPGYFSNPRGTFLHWRDASLIPRYLHFMTASVAVGGLVLALLDQRRGTGRTAGYMSWFTAATALQFVFGGWFLFSLAPEVRLALTGGRPAATAFFAAAMGGALLALVFGLRQQVRPAAAAVLFTVTAMVLVRDRVRTLYLAPYFSSDNLSVHSQYSPIMAFGLFIALGIAAVVYLVRLYGRK